MDNRFTRQLGITIPIICGAMYPCSNPELIAAVSEAGGIGIIQPISLTFVYGYDFREGIRRIRQLTQKPVGMNVLIESQSTTYYKKMSKWLDIALEEGIRFFITSLGKPDWVVERVHAAGGIVYHDVTHRHWAEKGIECGIDGLIAVNNRAGGHAGEESAESLMQNLGDLDLPLICAGGIGDENDFAQTLSLGYLGVQMGTRFIATKECHSSEAYKNAILKAKDQDIVLSERITGVPLSIIKTPNIDRMGLKAGPIARWMLNGSTTKHWMRMLYGIKSLFQIKNASIKGKRANEYWQAGKSVNGIQSIEGVRDIIQRFSESIKTPTQ